MEVDYGEGGVEIRKGFDEKIVPHMENEYY